MLSLSQCGGSLGCRQHRRLRVVAGTPDGNGGGRLAPRFTVTLHGHMTLKYTQRYTLRLSDLVLLVESHLHCAHALFWSRATSHQMMQTCSCAIWKLE